MSTENTAAAEPLRYTVVVTSCGRFDLLRRTLQTLRDTADIAPEGWIITEDSGDDAARAVATDLGLQNAEVIVNRPALGQMRSIDLAYSKVQTPYVFHCEDDWAFTRSGYIGESYRVLTAAPHVSIVCLRPRSEENKLVRDAPGTTIAGVEVYLLDPKLHPEYFSYAFNPGLRRMADYQRIGPFTPLGHEPEVSYAFKRAGFQIANLEHPAATHIGDGRHVEDPTMPKRARDPIAKLRRSISKRWKRLKRALSGR